MRLISSGAVPSSSFSVARLPSISLDQDSNSSSADPPRMRSQYPYSKAGRASFSTAVTLFQKARFSTSDCSASERAMTSCSCLRSGSLTKFFTTTWMPKKVLDMVQLDDPEARPKEPLRPGRTLLMRPVAGEGRTETDPNLEGRCFPTPVPLPKVREEKMVGRDAGR